MEKSDFNLGIYFSEENVWNLSKDISQRHPTEIQNCYVIFISNPSRTVPLWRQRAGRKEDSLVIWVNITNLLYKTLLEVIVC